MKVDLKIKQMLGNQYQFTPDEKERCFTKWMMGMEEEIQDTIDLIVPLLSDNSTEVKKYLERIWFLTEIVTDEISEKEFRSRSQSTNTTKMPSKENMMSLVLMIIDYGKACRREGRAAERANIIAGLRMSDKEEERNLTTENEFVEAVESYRESRENSSKISKEIDKILYID